MTNIIITLEQHHVCGWAHSLLWHRSDLYQLGTWPRLLTNRLLKIISASLPQQSSAHAWMSASLVTIQNDCFTFNFKGILSFLGVSFICFPGLAWREDGNARFWWYQGDNTSNNQQHGITQNSSPATSSRSLICSHKFYLIYFRLQL